MKFWCNCTFASSVSFGICNPIEIAIGRVGNGVRLTKAVNAMISGGMMSLEVKSKTHESVLCEVVDGVN